MGTGRIQKLQQDDLPAIVAKLYGFAGPCDDPELVGRAGIGGAAKTAEPRHTESMRLAILFILVSFGLRSDLR